MKKAAARGGRHASKSVSRILSKTAIYLDLPLPTGSSHLHGTAGQTVCPSAVLLRIEFTASACLHEMGELLPRLSTLTRREPGGISLLHLSEGCPWRVLPVILALWSPDFPHGRPFGLATRLSVLLARVILQDVSENVNGLCRRAVKEDALLREMRVCTCVFLEKIV